MLTNPVTLSIAPLSVRLDTCELCASGRESLHSWVVVRHARGGTVQLAACHRCAAAVRRIIAVAGGATAAGPAQLAASIAPTPGASVELGAVDAVGMPTLVHTFSDPFRAEDSATYSVRVIGQERSDGTWIGWLVFVGEDGHAARRTARETTQSTQEHLVYWATGLQLSYIEGAFSRAS